MRVRFLETIKHCVLTGCGGREMPSILDFCSDGPSSILVDCSSYQ